MWYIKIHYKKLLNQDEKFESILGHKIFWFEISDLFIYKYAKLKVQENFYQDKVSNNE